MVRNQLVNDDKIKGPVAKGKNFCGRPAFKQFSTLMRKT